MASYFNKRWFIYVDCNVYRPACLDTNVNQCPEWEQCPHVPIDVCPVYNCRQFYYKYSRIREQYAIASYKNWKLKKDILSDLRKAYNY